ncbi:MAG: hypothetical protein K1X57_21315 [Gemmataceae bacterium]|nr:hypothetical protein [Gemmataceae bacterium]
MAGEKVTTLVPSAAVAVEDGTGSSTAPVTSTITPGTGKSACVGSLSWSYDSDPTGGSITLTDGTTTLAWYIKTGGPGFLVFNPPIRFAVGSPVVGTIAQSGSINRSIHVSGFIDGSI